MASEFLYGVRTRRVASAGLDPLTPILLIAFVLGMLGMGAYAHSQLPKLLEAGKAVPSAGVLWTTIVVYIVMFFAIAGPMVLLGVFVASKIMNFPLSGMAYLKACGVATVPMLMVMSLLVLPANRVLLLLVIVAIIPVVFFVLKTTYELTLAEGGVTFVLAGITGLVGLMIASGIAKAVMQSGAQSQRVATQAGNNVIDRTDAVIPSLPSVTSPRIESGEANTTPTRSAADVFRDTLAARAAQTPDTSREQQQKELASLKSQAEQAGAASNADVVKMLEEMEKRAAGAPSEQPDPALFQEPVATAAFRPAESALALLNADEVSFQNFNLRVPKNFRADLDSSETDAKGLGFSSGRHDSAKLVLRTVPATNAKQRRPWVTRQKFQSAAAEREQLFMIDGSGAATVDEGTISGMPFTRVVHELGKRWGVHGKSALYVTRTGDSWLIIDAIAPSSTPATLELLEAAARTVRPRPAGDPVNDPLAAPALAARLAEDPDRVAQLLRLKGKAAEDAVIPQLKNTDARAARAAAAVLGDIGTEKSLPALQEAARSTDSFLAGAAREALKKLKPDAMDAVAEALLDLESNDTHRKRAALDRLAQAKPAPDDPRREKVAAVVEVQLLGSDAFFVADHAAPAMAAWAGKQTVPRLVGVLNDPNASMHQRRAIMTVFSKLKDERGVFPVVRWIIKDTDHVTQTLIEMGPVAEGEVMKLLKEKDASVRTAAARILQEIGTIKSVALLKRASQDQRDPGAAAAARVALDIVSERVKSAKTAATTAPGT